MKCISRNILKSFGAQSDAPLKWGEKGEPKKRSLLHNFFLFLRVLLPYMDKVIVCVSVICALSLARLLWPWLDKYFVDYALPAKNWNLLWAIVIAHVVLGLAQGYTNIINDIFRRYVELRVLTDMRARFYEHLIRLSMTFLQNRPIGEHMYRANADIQAILTMITEILPQFIEALFDFTIVFAFLAYLDWRVAVILFIYMIPYSLIAQWIASVERRFDREARGKLQRVEATLQEGVAGQLTVKTYARRVYEVHKYTGRLVDAWRSQMKKQYTQIVKQQLISGSGFVTWLKGFLVRAFFLRQAILGHMTYGSLLPIFNYMGRFSNPIQKIIELYQQLRVAMVPAERILQTLDVAPVVFNKPRAMTMPPLKGKVEFDDVRFSYEEGIPILHGLSFDVKPGQKAAFVGHSGAGKSTILNLMLRLYDPDAGRVMIDGIDLRDVRMESLQQQIGLVFQDTYLFGGTVRDNILFSQPHASEEAIQEAIRQADLEEFVKELPKGLDTDLNEGSSLSGGHKQRLGIARALVGNPKLLILDEPTSSLDPETEERLLETLKKVAKGRTTCLISHRMPTVIDADVIFVMDKGQIVEAGKHEDLMARCGYYFQLYTLYFTGKREEAA